MKQTHGIAWIRSLSTRIFATLAVLCLPLSSQAGLMTDFTDSSWQGEVLTWTDDGSPTGTETVSSGNIFGDFTDNFSLTSDTATLTTSENSADFSQNYGVVLFQEFMFDAVSTGSSLLLSLDISTDFTSPDDLFFAEIKEFNSVSGLYEDVAIDLSSGGTFDVTSLIGKELSIEFGAFDDDFIIGEWMQITNFALVEEVAKNTDIPEPSYLFAFALMLIGCNRAKHKFK